MKIKIIILDDEPLAVSLIEDYAKKVPELSIVHASTNVFDAISCLKSEEVDLIFIDIQMPELTGMEFMEMFSNYNFIITSAYPNYALDAFNFKVIDFLLKPVTFQRFYKSIDKFLSWKEQKTDQFLFVKADRKFHKVYFEKIIYIEGLRDYIRIYTDDEKVMVLENMKDFHDKLPKNKFVRVHRSYILALDRIKTIEGNRIILANGIDIPIGETYKKFVHKWVE